MSRYLVTGGAGFIGSHLCDALIARGDAVCVLDDFSTGHRSNLPPGIELLAGDIADAATALRATERIDGCFHLAAVASVERGINDWLGTHRTNLTGAISIFDAIRRHGTQVPVVYASSAAVYGDCQTIPIRETADRRPLSAFFNIYGPRQDPRSPYSGVISIFCERIRNAEPILIRGDGRQTRDFVHVSDAVAALLAAMRLRLGAASVFNVCTGEATSVLELADYIGKLAGKHPNVNHIPVRVGDIRHSLGDATTMREALGLSRMVPLRDGLVRLLAHAAQQ
jgi:UDP-glucose 4-epimerase